MEDKKAAEEAHVPVASVRHLLRFADKWARLLLLVGAIGAIGVGALMPYMGPLMGKAFNQINAAQANALATGQQLTADESAALLSSSISKTCWTMACFGAGLFGAMTLLMFGTRGAGARIKAKVKQECLKVALEQDCTYYDRESSGKVIHVLDVECTSFGNFFAENLGLYIQTTAQVISALAIAFSYSWPLTLVALACVPVIVSAVYITSKLSLRANKRSKDALQKASAYAKEVLSNVRTVYSFDAGERCAETYIGKVEEPLKAGKLAAFMGGIEAGTIRFCGYGAMPLVMWYGGVRVAHAQMVGGDVFSVMSPLLMAVMGLATTSPKLKYFPIALMALAEIENLVDSLDEVEKKEKDGMASTDLVKAAGDLALEDVRFAYPVSPDVEILHGVSLVVPAGTTAALVGESGSGKSTIVSLLLRLYDPTSGKILLDGYDARTLTLESYRSHIGLVSQEPVLFNATILDNIRYGKQGASDEEVYAAAKAAQIHEFIAALPEGYATLVGEKGTQLSGGQKQRVAIARTFLKAPKVFVLDEATSALDTQSERAIQEALRQLTAGTTTISIAHRLSTIRDCQLIAVMDHGNIVEQGSHDQLVAAGGVYSTLVSKYAKAIEVDEPIRTDTGKSLRFTYSKMTSKLMEEAAEEEEQRTHFRTADVTSLASVGSILMRSWQSANSMRVLSGKSLKGIDEDEDDEEAGKEPEVKVDKSRLNQLTKNDRGKVALGTIGSAINGATFPVIGLLLSLMTAAYYPPNNDLSLVEPAVQKWALIMTGIAISAGLADFTQSWMFGVVGQNIAYQLRCMMMRALMRQEVGWYDEKDNSSGAIISRLEADALAVKGQVSDNLGLVGQILGTLLAGYPISFAYQWQLTLILTAMLPVIVIFMGVAMVFMQKTAVKMIDIDNQAEGLAIEAISNYKTVHAFNLQTELRKAHRERGSVLIALATKDALGNGLVMGFMFFMLFGTYALSFWYGGQLVLKGKAQLNNVLASIFPVFLAIMFAGQAMSSFPEIAKASIAIQRVFGIIDRTPLIDNTSDEGVEPESSEGALAFRSIKFFYPQRPDVTVFSDLNIEVPKGKSVALVGPSGSGKSTIVGLTLRFYDPVSGNVLLDGKAIKSLNIHWLRAQIGLVGQEPVLFNGTIMDNIKYGRPDATEEECKAAAAVANASDFIAALPSGFDTPIGDQQIQLSGGQKQRIAIARAVVRNPKILVLDEATSALDATSERVVQEALDAAMVGRSALVIAHRLSTVRNVDCIYVLDRGNVIEQGNHNELMGKKGKYAAMVELQKMS